MVSLNYENSYQTHSFLMYKDNDYWCWFETADFDNRGIHKFLTFEELIKYQYRKYVNSLIKLGISNNEIKNIKLKEFSKPKSGITAQEYINHVINAKEIIINEV